MTTTSSAAPTQPPAGFARGLAFVLRWTQRRPLTVAEARAKLAAKELSEEAIEAVVARARALGALDDLAFARAWVHDRGVTRGYGAGRLRQELRRRKVDDAAAEAAMSQLEDVDVVAQATDLARARAQRMPASLPPQRVAQRLVGMLVRRGFTSDIAHQVARSVTALDREWD